MAECRVSFPVAVTPLLKLVVSGVPVVKFIDLVQVVGDIIGNRVYSAGQARGEVFKPPGNTNYLQINKQTMKMLKNYMIEGFSSTIFYTLVTTIFFIVYFVHW